MPPAQDGFGRNRTPLCSLLAPVQSHCRPTPRNCSLSCESCSSCQNLFRSADRWLVVFTTRPWVLFRGWWQREKKLRPPYLFHHIPSQNFPQTPQPKRHSLKNEHPALWNTFGIVPFGTRCTTLDLWWDDRFSQCPDSREKFCGEPGAVRTRTFWRCADPWADAARLASDSGVRINSHRGAHGESHRGARGEPAGVSRRIRMLHGFRSSGAGRNHNQQRETMGMAGRARTRYPGADAARLATTLRPLPPERRADQ